jgi:starch-binding outer membrane protein, SusD/RagB family
MKNIKQYLKKLWPVGAAAILLQGFSSCRKELNYSPEVFATAQSVYKDEPGAIAGVTGIYQQLQTLKKSDYQLIGVIGTDEVRCCYQAQGYGAYYAGIVGMDVYDITFNSQNADITGFWTVCYQGINNANAALLNIPQIKSFADPTIQTRLEGEAHFMRALYYFYLVQLYGDVPMPLENTSIANGLPRIPQAQVYAQIEADLKFASTNCWTKSKLTGSDVGRASVEAAKALLGKVYLTLHDYQDAKTTFEDLMNNYNISLLPHYADLFDGQHENNSESLFEIQYSTDNENDTQGLQNLYGSYAGPPIQGETWNAHTPGYGGTVVMATSFYSDSVFARPYGFEYQYDARFSASVNGTRFDPTSGATDSWWWDPGQPTVKKYDITSSDIDYAHSGKNLYYLRSADVLLMYAEVLNELGQTQAALAPINKIRERAFGNGSLDFATTDQATLRSEIMDERSRELGGEGWRWFDLKRTGLLVSLVNQRDNPYVERGGGNDPHPKQNVTAKNMLFPIPLTELQNNPALGLKAQNPGY